MGDIVKDDELKGFVPQCFTLSCSGPAQAWKPIQVLNWKLIQVNMSVSLEEEGCKVRPPPSALHSHLISWRFMFPFRLDFADLGFVVQPCDRLSCAGCTCLSPCSSPDRPHPPTDGRTGSGTLIPPKHLYSQWIMLEMPKPVCIFRNVKD